MKEPQSVNKEEVHKNWPFNKQDSVSKDGWEAKSDPKEIGEHESFPKRGGLREGKGTRVSAP